MKSNNTTNYNFLKNFKPELFKLAEKMEEDLLATPVSILAYATRFLEYILYDIAKDNNHQVNRESGFVNNIYELIQLDYLEYYLGDLMIKAYVFRNKSIHNTNIVRALKDDKKTAQEMNRRLFDIADVYYKNLTNNYEEHLYVEPAFDEEDESEISTIIKQDKAFDKCIVCGESTKFSKSNFCQEHDKLLNYREVLTKIITNIGTDSLFRKTDFSYGFKDQLINDLIAMDVFERIGNDFKINKKNLDDLFILTDKFMDIDGFLSEFAKGYIKNPELSKFYLSDEYPYCEVSKRVGEYYAKNMVELMENGFSYQNALMHIGNKKLILNKWYDDKKSDFIDGLNDELFIKYNELLIEYFFKQMQNNKHPAISKDKIEFWSQYFEGFAENLDDLISEKQMDSFMQTYRRNSSKEQALSQTSITEDELERYMSKNDDANKRFKEETERRKRLMLVCIDDGLNFEEALEKSKLVDKVQLFQQYKNITSLNRVVLDSFINKIEIGKSDSNSETRPIKIDWKLYAK